MARSTNIEWCDSTVNPTIGCEGCELWRPGRRVCYAGRFIEDRMAGRPGWPARFEDVVVKPGMMAPALRWPDLTGTARPDKPWLAGMPRCIFVDDLGDLFSPAVPFEFIADEVVIPAWRSRHILQLLTKRPKRAVEFATWCFTERGMTWPSNVWVGTSITSAETIGRVRELQQWPCLSTTLFLSIEPVTLPLPKMDLERMAWVVLGGESGPSAPALAVEPFSELVQSIRPGVSAFVKQLGSHVTLGGRRLHLQHSKGGDWDEWPEELRVRQMPVRWWKQASIEQASAASAEMGEIRGKLGPSRPPRAPAGT